MEFLCMQLNDGEYVKIPFARLRELFIEQGCGIYKQGVDPDTGKPAEVEVVPPRLDKTS